MLSVYFELCMMSNDRKRCCGQSERNVVNTGYMYGLQT